MYFNNDLDEDITIEELKIGNQEMDWFYHFDDKKAIIVTVQDSIYSNKEQISFKNIKFEKTILLDSSVINVSIPTEIDSHYLSLTSPEAKLSITPNKSGPPIKMVFTRPLENEQLNNINIELLIADTNSIPFIRTIESPMKMSIIPENGWEPKKSYQIKLFRQDSTRSKSTFKDSITIIHIETAHFQGYGGLSGMVKGYESTQLIQKY